MNLKVLIADDDRNTAEYLQKIIEDVPGVKVVGIAANGKEVIREVEIHLPDVVFLDIDMPGMNGLEAARQLAKMQPDLAFVFATAYPDYTLEAFALYSFDYILKPFDEKRIRKTIRRLRDRICEDQNQRKAVILIQSNKLKLAFHPEEILCIESRRHKILIKTERGDHLVPGKLCELEQQLDPRIFFRSHRGYLVNIEKIKEIIPSGQSYNIVLDSGDMVLLSREREKALRKRFG